MSTQHPDNVSPPFFATGPLMTAEDEIREAYYAFSHLGCDEQMWDYEGKEVDPFVVEKLLTTYDSFFRAHPLGERSFLTPRVPNPALERSQAKVLLEVLHSLPRHSDAARLFYGEDRVPVFELIFPATASADELERVARYYERFVVGVEDVALFPGDVPLRSWFGEFHPRSVAMIPLIEQREHLLAADAIVRAYAGGRRLGRLRVFIARSDPALNYGMASAVLLSLVALSRIERLEREIGIPIHPIVGLGSPPFRGGLRPSSVARCLARYPSVRTFTIQSSFKYDHPASEVAAAIGLLRAAPRGEPVPVDEPRARSVIERVAARYREEVATLAPLVNALAAHVPRRRLRKLHIGLFGYSRSNGGISLPRAIPFAASLYAVGLPPEALGLAALDEGDRRWLAETVPGWEEELAEAARYLDLEATRALPPRAREAAVAFARHAGGDAGDAAHAELSRAAARTVAGGDLSRIGEVIVRAAAVRGFLG